MTFHSIYKSSPAEQQEWEAGRAIRQAEWDQAEWEARERLREEDERLLAEETARRAARSL